MTLYDPYDALRSLGAETPVAPEPETLPLYVIIVRSDCDDLMDWEQEGRQASVVRHYALSLDDAHRIAYREFAYLCANPGSPTYDQSMAMKPKADRDAEAEAQTLRDEWLERCGFGIRIRHLCDLRSPYGPEPSSLVEKEPEPFVLVDDGPWWELVEKEPERVKGSYQHRANARVENYADDLALRLIEVAHQFMEMDLDHVAPSVVAQSCQMALVYSLLIAGRDEKYLAKLIEQQRIQFSRYRKRRVFAEARKKLGITELITDPEVDADLQTVLALFGAKSDSTVQ